MTEIVTIEWRFSPSKYFEEMLRFPHREANITIADGKIEATMPADVFDADPSIRQSLHDHLVVLFRSVQLLTHEPYTLTRVHTARIPPDGKRSITVELDNASNVVVAGFDTDFQVIDKDGNIVADSKRDRIKQKISLITLASRHLADSTLAAMLRSYDAAVYDPNNELVHLYEIREAVSKELGSADLVRAALSISSKDWSQFGRLCNDEPLWQGRHRGKSGGALRNASAEELKIVRNFVRHLIEAYLQYLDSKSAP